jgi:glutamine phosphoribosylpyrophosphate amidotransferase
MCGFIGVIGAEPAVKEIYDGLLSIQHRGQDLEGQMAVLGAGGADD